MRDRGISRLLAQGAWLLDEDKLEEWVSLFDEAGVYRITTRESVAKGYPASIVYCEGRAMLEDRVRALRQANIFEPHWYSHVLSIPYTRTVDGAEETETRFTVSRIFEDGRTDLFATGKYVDRYAWRDDAPRILSRVVVLDSGAIDVLLVIPL